MLSIQWIFDEEYYLKKARRRRARRTKDLRPGPDDEPADEGDAPTDDLLVLVNDGAYWWGSGAYVLRLSGRVKEEVLKALFAGFGPDGRPLVQNAGRKKRQKGWDLTFSAPKWVSVLWTAVDDDTRRRIEDILRRAVEAALRYIEEVAIFTRRGKGGTVIEHAMPVVAIFPEATSRAFDPQLHSHCLVLNVAVRGDRTVGAVFSEPLYKHKLTAGAIYQAELAYLLKAELGLSLEEAKVAFRLTGVPQELVDFYSTRRKQIVDALKAKGFFTAKAASVAALDTRKAGRQAVVKRLAAALQATPQGQEPSIEDLLEIWRTENKNRGFMQPRAMSLLNRATPRKDPNLWNEIAQALGELLSINSFFSEQELIREVARTVMHQGVPSDEIIRQVRVFLLHDKRIVPITSNDQEILFTTRHVLKAERRLLGDIVAGLDHKSHLVRRANVNDALDKALPLDADLTADELTRNKEQRNAVVAVTTRPGNVQVIEGMAGTGKTHTLKIARQIWHKAGFRVVGMALSSVAAGNLQDGAGIESDNLAMRLVQLDSRGNLAFHNKRQLKRLIQGKPTYAYRGREFTLNSKTIVVVDEAAMIGTRQLAKLYRHIKKAGAKLVLVGDRRQVQPIEAGCPFARIADIVGKAELKHVVRQTLDPDDPNPTWHRDVGKLFAAGHVAHALKLLHERGRLSVVESRDQAILSLVQDWSVEGIANPTAHLILAGVRAEVDKLNRMCQEARIGAGGLTGTPVQVGDWQLFVGDAVLCTKNSRTLKVKNGDRGTIVGINRLRRLISIRLDRTGESVVIPYRSYPHIDLAYATTTHKAQGTTVPNVYILLGGSLQDRHLSYVQITRAKESTRLYTDATNAGHELKYLTQQMERERPKLLAHDLLYKVDSDPPSSAIKSTDHARHSGTEDKSTTDGPTTDPSAKQNRQNASAEQPQSAKDIAVRSAPAKPAPGARKQPNRQALAPRRNEAIPAASSIEVTSRRVSSPAKPSVERRDLLDLSHVTAVMTTDAPVLDAARARYGKVPGGIVVEGDATCDVPITSLSVGAEHPGRVLVNGTLEYDSGLDAEEVALIWHSVFGSGMGVKDFGVLAQWHPIGIESNSKVALTMTTADNALGGLMYGHDSWFVLYKSSVPAFTNPLLTTLNRLDDPAEVAREFVHHVLDIQPRLFLTISRVRFAQRGPRALKVAGTSVQLALGTLTDDQQVVPPITFEQIDFAVGTRFPWIKKACECFVAHFAEFCREHTSLARTLAYAELVALFRRARSTGATLFGNEIVDRTLSERLRLLPHRFNYTLRDPTYARYLAVAASRLCQTPSPDLRLRFMQSYVAFMYANYAGDLEQFLACKQTLLRNIEWMKQGLRAPAYRPFRENIPSLVESICNTPHDRLIECCFWAAREKGISVTERDTYLNDALSHCGDREAAIQNTATRCLQIEIECYCDRELDPLQEFATLRRADPLCTMPFVSLARINWARRLGEGLDGDHRSLSSAIAAHETQLGLAKLSETENRLWARAEACLTPTEQLWLLESLAHVQSNLSEYVASLLVHPASSPVAVLKTHLAERLRRNPITQFSPHLIHPRNFFWRAQELLALEPPENLTRLFQKLWHDQSVFDFELSLGPWGAPPTTDRGWWELFLNAHAVFPRSRMSKEAVLLAFELPPRGLTIRSFHKKMVEYGTGNPQAALFFYDAELFAQKKAGNK